MNLSLRSPPAVSVLSLPFDVLRIIAAQLSLAELFYFDIVCKKFHACCNSDRFWQIYIAKNSTVELPNPSDVLPDAKLPGDSAVWRRRLWRWYKYSRMRNVDDLYWIYTGVCELQLPHSKVWERRYLLLTVDCVLFFCRLGDVRVTFDSPTSSQRCALLIPRLQIHTSHHLHQGSSLKVAEVNHDGHQCKTLSYVDALSRACSIREDHSQAEFPLSIDSLLLYLSNLHLY